jgi:hypothetical protein
MCSFCYIIAIYFTRSIYVTSNAVICDGDSDEHSVLRPTRIRVAELRSCGLLAARLDANLQLATIINTSHLISHL